MSISYIIIGMCSSLALAGCMRNDCVDGNDVDRGSATVALSRFAINSKLSDNKKDLSRQWWWCETNAISVPPVGSRWFAITIDAPRNTVNGIGGWVRPTAQDAHHYGLLRAWWWRAAVGIASDIIGVDFEQIECITPEQAIDDLDLFVACKEPVKHGPVSPSGGNDPTPLPPGSTSGDP